MIATPHRARPVEVLITEPLTTANRGEVARWLEDQGIGVAVPADTDIDIALVLAEHAVIGTDEIVYGDRLVYDGARAQAVDQAHYKLWYEPVETPAGRTEPS